MATITLKGNPIHTSGDLPHVGQAAPDFTLTKTDLSEIKLTDFKGKQVILNIFPSIDTPTCATSVRKFNQEASTLSDVVVLCVSMDLPFAQSRFCGAEGLDKVVPVSGFRHPEFGQRYGISIVDGPLKGLFARTIVVINAQGQVAYTELVSEVANEPDYAEALKAI